MAKTRTNTAFVRHIMTNCPTGALGQAFVIEAVRRYAEQCSKADPAEMTSAMVSGESWQQTARFVLGEYESNYGRRS